MVPILVKFAICASEEDDIGTTVSETSNGAGE